MTTISGRSELWTTDHSQIDSETLLVSGAVSVSNYQLEEEQQLRMNN